MSYRPPLGSLVLSMLALAACSSAESGGEADFQAGSGAGSSTSTGKLTGADWDDNLNYGLFKSYVSDFLQSAPGYPSFPSHDRVVVRVVNEEGEPVPSARVTVSEDGQALVSMPTATDGRALFFPARDGGGGGTLSVLVDAPPGQNAASVTVVAPEGDEWTVELTGATPVLPPALDLAFVVDVTGSMSDELEFLKTEVQVIADQVHASFGDVDVRYALIVYRDEGDEYVTRTFDFTADLAHFKGDLGQQFADGGGDYPEAMDAAMAETVGLAWRPGNVARVSFLVADAPPHVEDAESMLDLANAARFTGIKLYPVAASGVADEAEYLMRVAAQATLGRYLFLTDDSGVGDPHAEPHFWCYQVELLTSLLERMIASELSGVRVPAAPDEVIRAVGDPVDGVCTAEDGQQAFF
jgi:hypothetical protein